MDKRGVSADHVVAVHPAKTMIDQADAYRILAENARVIMFIVSREGTVLYLNSFGCQFLGLEQEDIIGRPVKDLFPSEAIELKRPASPSAPLASVLKAREVFEDVTIRGETVSGREIDLVRKDGEERLMVLSGAPIYRDGEICGFAGTAEDITDRKKIQKALSESETTVRTLLNVPNAEAFIVDCEGVCLDANEALVRRLGGEMPDIIGKPIWDFLPADVCVKRKAYFEGVLREKKHVCYEDERDGLWSEVIITPILDSSGEVVKVTVSAFDITARKQTEAVLMESEEKLRMRARELEENRDALKVLLQQRENDRKELEEKILSNLKFLILPYIEKMKINKSAAEDLVYLNIIEANIREIVSPFAMLCSSKYLGLTAREMHIANLIRDGKQDKDISEILSLSLDTVKTHRKNIRKKFDIAGKKVNLKTYLISLSE